MASPQVSSALQAIQTAPAGDKPARYSALLQELAAGSSETTTENFNAYAQTLLDDSLGIVVLRPLLAAFVDAFKQIKAPDVRIDVGEKVTSLLQSKGAGQYEDQDTAIKMSMADAYESIEDWRKSAQTLATINLESTQKSTTADDKAKVWVRIVRCYLEEDDPTSAFTHLNKIKNIIFSVTDKETRIHFQLSQARIYDSQRAFLDAAQAYFTLSNEPNIAPDEREEALGAALICAVLAPAGPLRGRMLAKLYKDERASGLDDYSTLR